jgi:hypothetical protein
METEENGTIGKRKYEETESDQKRLKKGKKEKKEKKEKKDKKNKKEKKLKKVKNDDSDHSGQEINLEPVWVEKAMVAAANEESTKREDWMLAPPTSSRDYLKKGTPNMVQPKQGSLSWRKSKEIEPISTVKLVDLGAPPPPPEEDHNSTESQSITSMKFAEKSNNNSFDLNYAKNIARNPKFRNPLQQNDNDAEDLIDAPATSALWENPNAQFGKKRLKPHVTLAMQEKQKQQQQNKTSKLQKILDKCWFCVGPKTDRSLWIALGNYSYVCLPKRGTLTPGHCLIVPMSHVTALSSCDEEIWHEMQQFRKSLTAMFDARGEDVIFWEISWSPDQTRHTFVECVPISRDLNAADAAIYFKKAILEEGSEWSQHRKIYETRGEKNLRKVIATGFPYFHVEFGGTGGQGFVHVIENESKFPKDFARAIVAGMLGLHYTEWAKPKNDSQQETKTALKDFLRDWDKFDWTKELDNEEEQILPESESKQVNV